MFYFDEASCSWTHLDKPWKRRIGSTPSAFVVFRPSSVMSPRYRIRFQKLRLHTKNDKLVTFKQSDSKETFLIKTGISRARPPRAFRVRRAWGRRMMSWRSWIMYYDDFEVYPRQRLWCQMSIDTNIYDGAYHLGGDELPSKSTSPLLPDFSSSWRPSCCKSNKLSSKGRLAARCCWFHGTDPSIFHGKR